MNHATLDDVFHVPLFKSLTSHQLEQLARRITVERVGSGTVLAREGEPGRVFSMLAEGAAQVTIADSVVGWLYRFDFYGELSLLGDGKRHATVTALEPSTVWSFDRRTFNELEMAHPEIASVISDVARDRVESDARLLVR